MLQVRPTALVQWLDFNYDNICDDLSKQQAELEDWLVPSIPQPQADYVRLLNEIDAEASKVEEQMHGPVAMKAHVNYDTLRVKDLVEYLVGWQHKFSAYQALTGLHGCDLVITHFRTGNSFDAEIRITRRGSEADEPGDPTAGMFAFSKLIDEEKLPKVEGRAARATDTARKARERAKKLPNLRETLTIAPARGGD